MLSFLKHYVCCEENSFLFVVVFSELLRLAPRGHHSLLYLYS